jgi:hypothetical protein
MTFYLSSSDSSELNAHPRRCTVLRWVMVGDSTDGLALMCDPPLPSDNGDIDRVIVTPKWQEQTLRLITKWPFFVYVFREPWEAEVYAFDDLRPPVYWGELFQTEVDARANYHPPMHQER